MFADNSNSEEDEPEGELTQKDLDTILATLESPGFYSFGDGLNKNTCKNTMVEWFSVIKPGYQML